MRTIETTANVAADGTLTARVPLDIPPGEHRAVLVIEERVHSPDEGAGELLADLEPLEWAAWPADASFRREDLYGDDGR